ncbi:ABC transporter ATP-binding protein [Actinomadura rugatobispora]|uniref:ABC transporter ATP-binding protein n=1 Tax=Actinomadura rugatobispora TaxID=1994 RepID=A0ABW1A7B1_9ACTN|nr:ABC transporter ATP-binding protein [Actinomadura rugatobispora]
MSRPLLEIRDLTVSYGGGSVAVDHVDLDVHDGEVCLVLGANGAGKTSLLRGVGGFASSERGRVRGGRVLVGGVDVTGLPPRAMVGHGVVLVPEETKVFGTLTVGENLRAAPAKGGRASRAALLEEAVSLFPFIAERMNLPAGQLSGGERQQLGIARALLLSPRLLMVDEASLGLSPIAVRAVFESLRALVDSRGTTLLIVEQNVRAAQAIADRAHVMVSGSVALTGPAREVLQSERVRRTYLGLEV